MKLLIKLMLLLLVMGAALPFVTLGPNGGPLFKLTDLKLPDTNMPQFVHSSTLERRFSSDPESSTTKPIYKWLDSDGQIHYTTESPPAGKQAEILLLDSDTNVVLATKPNTSEKKRLPNTTDQLIAPSNRDTLYSPDGVQQIMDSARNIQGLLDKRQREYNRLLDSLDK